MQQSAVFFDVGPDLLQGLSAIRLLQLPPAFRLQPLFALAEQLPFG